MDFITIAFAVLIVFLVTAWISTKGIIKNSLPGPIGLPIVGYLPFLTRKPYVAFQQLAKKYGPVYSVRLGSRNIVILTDFKIIKDAFNDDAFMGRPDDLPFELSETTIRTGAFLGLPWKEQRRFSLHALRDLGFGKTQMEVHIKDEIDELLERMDSLKSQPMKMSELLAPSASNNIASLLFGKRLKFNDPKRKKLDQLFSDVGLLGGSVGWQMFFPWIRKFMVFFNIGKNGKLHKALTEVKSYVLQEVLQHESSIDPNNVRDFVDRYILEIQKKNDLNSTFQRDVLIDTARGFFGAGSETVRITVDWILLVMAGNPEIQNKIHHEIDEILGSDRFPTWQDRIDMPYTEAVICEVMRWKTIIPINIVRSTLKDTELCGYSIPKKHYVLAILYAVDHDEKLWGKDCHEFRPERFLSEDGKKVIKPEYFIPFSIGKRQCPGKVLAEIEIFLYVTAILQKYKLSMPSGKKPNYEGILGIGLQPERQGIYIESR